MSIAEAAAATAAVVAIHPNVSCAQPRVIYPCTEFSSELYKGGVRGERKREMILQMYIKSNLIQAK